MLTAQNGLEQLFNQLTRPKLRALLDECYRDTSYLLDDDDYAEAEELDIVRKRFQRAWEGLVDGYKVGLAILQNTMPAGADISGRPDGPQLSNTLQSHGADASETMGEDGDLYGIHRGMSARCSLVSCEATADTTARCDQVRSRYSRDCELSFDADELWRRPGEVYAIAADRDGIEHGPGELFDI